MLAFDVGANVGRWSLSNASRFDKIVAVEASPSTFERLRRGCDHVPAEYGSLI